MKVFDVARDGGLREIPEMGFVFASDALVTQVDWALEGQVLAVSANDGVARAFLAALPRLADADGARMRFSVVPHGGVRAGPAPRPRVR